MATTKEDRLNALDAIVRAIRKAVESPEIDYVEEAKSDPGTTQAAVDEAFDLFRFEELRRFIDEE